MARNEQLIQVGVALCLQRADTWNGILQPDNTGCWTSTNILGPAEQS